MYYKIPCSSTKCIIKSDVKFPPNRSRNQFKEMKSGEGVSKESEELDKEEKPILNDIIQRLQNIEVRK